MKIKSFISKYLDGSGEIHLMFYDEKDSLIKEEFFYPDELKIIQIAKLAKMREIPILLRNTADAPDPPPKRL